MIIYKILNNNVVVTMKDNYETILMGKGIAYRRKVGDRVSAHLIDKEFTLKDKVMSNRLITLLQDIPIEYVDIAQEIIDYAKLTLGKRISENLIIALSDHMNSSIQRYKEGISLSNMMLWDIKRFYGDEYEIGKQALDIINRKAHVKLPDEEAGFIALHFANSLLDDSQMQDIVKITKVMQEINNIVKYHFSIIFDEDSLHYYRYINHLKYFAQRLITHTTYDDKKDSITLDIIKNKYPNPYSCVTKIEEFIQNTYDYMLSDEEKLYLTIHIAKITIPNN